ncbi:hypothetical protein DYB25_000076 [Aphanomyces astaci]|uniref:Protein kinase domain-containing protein n=1 Tax=Aphanomyces astaci TaxID=112090 RepID=A0A397B4J5_APHAT|nr:hypothetical protein DYB25_000076 [Aphanomyces astaci]RHY44266.1 hypothetical protein DYB30_002058 [Aphanomyces astaci]RHY61744.1 hypothetical protein DYB38_002481 [Aphanomyces astaci]RHY72251.1 hypothetical protein DYB34_001517 [Aphanomyces astaci]RHY96895.1 hypothetical protein DYB26_001464 [Aphanomyces astaci]
MDRYTVERTLSIALFGDVVLCHDNTTANDNRPTSMVAIKRMDIASATARQVVGSPRHVAEDIEFERHVNLTLTRDGKRHPNVLAMRDSFVDSGVLHFVFDYCAGGELFQVTDDLPGHRVDGATARRYFRDIVLGVAYVHAMGFAHRDLSLENVLVDANDVCVVCDFGLASSLTAHPTDQSKVGKAFYMAPEVVADAALPYDLATADVWSLGILLFVLVTGAPLVELAALTDVRFQYLEAEGVRALVKSWDMMHLFDPQCMSLLEGMLCVDALYRISMDDILRHPYICGTDDCTSCSVQVDDVQVGLGDVVDLKALNPATQAMDLATFTL